MNKSNEGYFGKRFVKVYFNVLHQRLACELPPAEVTAAFSIKKKKIVIETPSPCLEDRTVCVVNEA